MTLGHYFTLPPFSESRFSSISAEVHIKGLKPNLKAALA